MLTIFLKNYSKFSPSNNSLAKGWQTIDVIKKETTFPKNQNLQNIDNFMSYFMTRVWWYNYPISFVSHKLHYPNFPVQFHTDTATLRSEKGANCAMCSGSRYSPLHEPSIQETCESAFSTRRFRLFMRRFREFRRSESRPGTAALTDLSE